MNNIEIILQIILGIFDLYIIQKFLSLFFDSNVPNKNLTLSLYATRFFVQLILNKIAPYPLLNAIIFISTIYVIALSYDSKFSKKIIVSVIIFICEFVCELLLAIVLGLTDVNPIEKISYGNVFISFISYILFWMTSLPFEHLKSIGKNTSTPKWFSLLLVLIPILSIMLEIALFKENNLTPTIYLISITCVILTNCIIIYLYDSFLKYSYEQTQIELVKKEREAYREQSELLQTNQAELKNFRHDINNRLLALQAILDRSDITGAKKYINKMTEKTNNISEYSKSGNIAIDSMINYKLSIAKKNDIKIKCYVTVPTNLNIDNDDLIIIIGNLLDNAIEATLKLQSDRFIKITLEFSKGCLFIFTQNNYNSKINVANGIFQTTKTNKKRHGIGLKSVESTIAKYNGLLDTSYDDEIFETSVLLFNEKQEDLTE